MGFKIAPSILSADFLHLEKDIRLINECGDMIHLDIMDGTFVPNISFGFPVVEQVAKIAERPMDAHLMVVHPERWFEKLASYGVSYCSFHLETAKEDTEEFLGRIRALGMRAGLAINPDVPVEELYPYIGKADFFLIMSVFAGFGGQKFIPESLTRVKALKKEIELVTHQFFAEGRMEVPVAQEQRPEAAKSPRQGVQEVNKKGLLGGSPRKGFIEIDGGINLSNIRAVRDAGVNVAVAGSSVFGAPDPAKAILELREA